MSFTRLGRKFAIAVGMTLSLGCGVITPMVRAQAPPPAVPATPPPEAMEKGRDLFQQGKFEEAVEAWRQAGKADPNLPPPRVILTEMFIAAGQGPAARASLEQAAADDPDHPAVVLLNGSLALAEGRLTDTILSCQAALRAAESPRWNAEQRDRYTRESRLGLATAYEARRDANAAREQLQALLKTDPQNAAWRVRLANALFRLNKPDEAETELREAVKTDATLGPAELAMARLWAGRADAKQAQAWYVKAIAAQPENARVYHQYGGWLLEQGRVDEAKAQVALAEKYDPNSRDTAVVKGLLARYTRDFSGAEAIFDKLHRDSPADRFAMGNLALALAESVDKARQRRGVELAENLARQDQNPSADSLAVLGWCYHKIGRTDEALRALSAAVSGGRAERDTAYYLARVLAAKERHEEAFKILKNALTATGPFVNASEAAKLAAELEPKQPAPEKKP